MEESTYIKSFASGNREAFEYLFMRYQPGLVRFLTGFIHDPDTARDMASDLFMSLWEHRSSLSELTSFSSYLYKMARNAAANYYEHMAVTKKYTLSELLNPATDCSTEERLFYSDMIDIINDTLSGIPERRKQVFLMSRLQGLNNDEIALRLGVTKKTVENHITTVLSELRRALKVLSCFILLLGCIWLATC